MQTRTIPKLATLVVMLLFLLQTTFAQTRTVTGTVTDQTGAVVPNATISVKGTNTATQTDANGRFSINAADNAVLVISSVGYGSLEVPVSGQSTVNASLTNQNSNLNEVVVIGYGTARRKDVTGSVSSVSARDFNKGIQTSPDQLIQGKVAGVQVTNNSGAPGGGVTVRVRGATSVRGGNQPLFVVDGVPLDNRSSRPGLGNLPDLGNTPGGNPLNFINPNDIASIDVLKDASATAIYGSRGANGVVIITTKKGQTGAPKIDFSTSLGVSSILKRLEVLDGNEYRQALKDFDAAASANYGDNVDALGSILQKGLTQNHSVAVSGGNDVGRYRFSLGYLDQEGIIRKTDFKKYTANLSSSFKFLESKKLLLDVNLITSQTRENVAPISNNAGAKGSMIGQALQWNPTRPLRKPDGSLNVDQGGDQINPLALSEAYNDRTRLTTILASISPGYKFTNELEYRFLYSVNYGTGLRQSYISSFINLGEIQASPGGTGGQANIGNNELLSQQFTHTLSYNKEFSNALTLNSVIGYEYLKGDNSGSSMQGRRFPNTSLPYYRLLQYPASGDRSMNTFADPTTELQSVFGRATVNYLDKYLLTATLRADGSSKFGKENRYGYFPSFAAAWNIGNEEFFKNDFASNLKLRLGWGKTGNQEFPAGASQETWEAGQGTFRQVQIANPSLQWESVTTTNAALDFTILKNRISGTIEYFTRTTENLLFASDAADPVSPSGAIQWKNLDADVENKGVEIALNTSIVQANDWNWDFGVNASFLKNRVKNFGQSVVETGEISGQGLSGVRGQLIVNNQPLNVFYLKRFTGIDKATGISTYEGGEEKFFAGDPNPDVLLGITTRASYKNLTLEVAMNGAFGHQIYNNTANAVLGISNLGKRNIGKQVYADALALGEGTANPVAASSRYLEKGDYLKLNNATLSYRLGNVGSIIKNASVYVTGQNLFVITNYSGFDPEINTDKGFNGIPSFGIEYTPYPTPRTVTVGLNFSF